MSSSTPIRFLLDENVRIELAKFLSKRGFDCRHADKPSVDRILADISLKEERIIVTNDSDFAVMCKGDVYGVVWLRLPQNDPDLLLKQFGEMLDANPTYADSLVVLGRDKRRVVPLLIRHRPGKNS